MRGWKYGTILRRNGPIIAMVVGTVSKNGYQTSDGLTTVYETTRQIGTTIINPNAPSAWGNPGDTTWLLDDDWEIVE